MTDWNPEDKALIDNAFKDLLNSIEYKTDKDDVDLIKRAFRLANDAHNGIRRKTGEPYITHPIDKKMNFYFERLDCQQDSTIVGL